MQGAGVELESVLEGVRVHREQGGDIQHTVAGSIEGLAGQHVDVWVCQLLAHDLAVGGLVDDMIGQLVQVVQTAVQDGRGGVCLGLHDAYDGQLLAVGHQLLHIGFIVQLAQPDLVLGVVDIAVGLVDKFEGHAKKIVIGIGAVVRG